MSSPPLSRLFRRWHALTASASPLLHTIGITGSNGKTVVKELLYQLLSPCFHTMRSPRSYNSQIGVPLSVLSITATDEVALIEAGISRPGEMAALEEVIAPQLGVFTSLGSAHQEGFASLEEKLEEKPPPLRALHLALLQPRHALGR